MQQHLDAPSRHAANFVPLIPMSFLRCTSAANRRDLPSLRRRSDGQGHRRRAGITAEPGLCADPANWQDVWGALAPADLAKRQAIQGVGCPMVEDIRVIDRKTGLDVPQDGASQGEIAIRGKTVMKNYFKDIAATDAALDGGSFWSGDTAVIHSDGHVDIRNSLKAVVILGDENIRSVKAVAVLYNHPQIRTAAVITCPHSRWGETPCDFVEVCGGADLSGAEIFQFCRISLARFKTPKSVMFCDLPKTATGKIQKFLLRDKARALGPQE